MPHTTQRDGARWETILAKELSKRGFGMQAASEAFRPMVDREAVRLRTIADREGPMAERLAYRVKDAAQLLGMGKSKLFALIADGQLPARKIGAATVILRSDLIAFLERALVRLSSDIRN